MRTLPQYVKKAKVCNNGFVDLLPKTIAGAPNSSTLSKRLEDDEGYIAALLRCINEDEFLESLDSRYFIYSSFMDLFILTDHDGPDQITRWFEIQLNYGLLNEHHVSWLTLLYDVLNRLSQYDGLDDEKDNIDNLLLRISNPHWLRLFKDSGSGGHVSKSRSVMIDDIRNYRDDNRFRLNRLMENILRDPERLRHIARILLILHMDISVPKNRTYINISY